MMGDNNSPESKQIDKIEDQIKEALREIELITKQQAKIKKMPTMSNLALPRSHKNQW